MSIDVANAFLPDLRRRDRRTNFQDERWIVDLPLEATVSEFDVPNMVDLLKSNVAAQR